MEKATTDVKTEGSVLDGNEQLIRDETNMTIPLLQLVQQLLRYVT